MNNRFFVCPGGGEFGGVPLVLTSTTRHAKSKQTFNIDRFFPLFFKVFGDLVARWGTTRASRCVMVACACQLWRFSGVSGVVA